jgi:hypothetical protein
MAKIMLENRVRRRKTLKNNKNKDNNALIGILLNHHT